MTRDDDRLWADRSLLRDVQYRTDANLAARQSLYRWQRPRLSLPSLVLDLAAVRGSETVADVGCGHGQLVNGSSRWLKAQVPCLMPEQVLLSAAPRQPPLSRWIAQIDRKFIRCASAKRSILRVSRR